MKRKVGKILMGLGAALMFMALLLFLYNKWQDYSAKEAATDVLKSLDEAIDADKATVDVDMTDDITEETTEMDTVLIDGYYYIGKLSIERFGLELPVMSEWSYDGMKIAPGRYQGTVSTSDIVICGHNYSRHFGNLKELEPGDKISFTDVHGNVYDYEVTEVSTLAPTAIAEMIDKTENEWDLTLFTCTLGGQARVTVRCQMVAEE